MKLFHISDLHFQTDAPALEWLGRGWRRALAHSGYVVGGRRRQFLHVGETVKRLLLEAERRGAEHLVVSGDLTTLALEDEFADARAALEPWAGRMTVIPGNHDRYTLEAARRRLFEKAFGPLLRSDLPELCAEGEYPLVRIAGDAALIGLCSARAQFAPGVAFGWVGGAQRQALARILREPRLEGLARFVVVHHGPYRSDGRPDHLRHGLRDAPSVLDVAARSGATALLHGHIHHRYRLSGPGNLPIFCAGSSTQAGREGYWLYDVGRDGLRSAEAVSLS